jgi:alanine racemase
VSRPTRLIIDQHALLHNVAAIKRFAPGKPIIAMVKANAYGCGLQEVVPILQDEVHAFGVACLEEALKVRALGASTSCVVFQGAFSADEYAIMAEQQLSTVVHQHQQLAWLLHTPLKNPISIWIKANTGMNRLGFNSDELPQIVHALHACPWVKQLGLMTHLACADEPDRAENKRQIALFQQLHYKEVSQYSMANSAAIIALPQTHADVVRPGIMLYGVSPFTNQTAFDLGLIPVMRFLSAVSAIHHLPAHAAVGYGGTWNSKGSAIIGIVAAGYGDGYPRHISEHTPVWIKGREVSIIGRVSMDMLAVDLTDHQDIVVGDEVELWGAHILIERVAKAAGTIGYELLCQISERVRF